MFRLTAFLLFLWGLIAACPDGWAAPPGGVDWVETFSDEFTGNSLQGNVWTSGKPLVGDSAPEEAHGTLLSDGILHLVTRHHDGSPREWTSASVSPRRFRQRYGYAEIRMRFARATGLNNVVMLVSDGSSQASRVEIVLVEGRYPSGLVIKLKRPSGQTEILSLITNAIDFSASYHLFGFSWLPDGKGATHLVWYLDGTPIHQADCPECSQTMRLWIGTHVTTWAGPFAPVSDGASMDVDYVRVYQDRSLLTR